MLQIVKLQFGSAMHVVQSQLGQMAVGVPIGVTLRKTHNGKLKKLAANLIAIARLNAGFVQTTKIR